MKIGILTFHASHNYGSMLQAYALQRYLNTHGHDAETINLRIKFQQELYNYPLKPVSWKYKPYINSLANPVWLYHACRKWQKYERFLKENIRLTENTYANWDEVRADLPRLGYECIITGGDQIWNMNCKDFTVSYYLPSALQGIRKVSYSPSFGGAFLSKITSEQKSFIKRCLSDYDHISVRESSMQFFLSELLDNKKVTIAADPTLLLNADDFNALISEKAIVEGKYIFYYTPRYNGKAERLAKLIGQQYGIKVVTSFPHILNNRGMKTVPEAGPAEFLNLLKNATMVIGKSFHLVVFSLLFHKDFIAVDGDKDARMVSILEKLGIKERGEVNESNYKDIALSELDYMRIDGVINEMRKDSETYIHQALNSFPKQ